MSTEEIPQPTQKAVPEPPTVEERLSALETRIKAKETTDATLLSRLRKKLGPYF